MKKSIFKKCCMFFMIFGLTISCFSIPTYASDNANNSFYEYDMIVNELRKSRSVKDIENSQKELLALKEHIYNMKEKPIEELKAYGYTENQIYNIKNYDGSDEMTRRASALVTRESYTFTKNEYSKSKDRTNVEVKAVYNINGVPSPNLNAALAIGFHDGGIWYDSGKGSMTINYTGYANNQYQYATKTTSGSTASNSTGARKFQFALHTNNSSGHLCYAKKLTVTFSAGRQGKIAVTQCIQQFSRQSLTGSASISFGVVGISLNLGGTGKINFGAIQSELKKTVS